MIEVAEIVPEKPTISLDSKTLPAIKKWQVGKTYEVHLKIREKSVREDYTDKKVQHATFEVNSAEVCDE